MESPDSPVSALSLDLPDAVRSCVARIEAEGAKVWLVGGAVRNALLGRAIEDWDLATSARPDRLDEWFPERVDLDPRYGRLCIQRIPFEILVTSCREEDGYTDHRHPDRVRFVEDPAVDAQRRDFTVNAIYADPNTGRLFDPCGGIEDLLVTRRLRMIGDRELRLVEDPLRILRAVRFSAAYGLALEPALRATMSRLVAELAGLSVDRRRMELLAMITGSGAGSALLLLESLGFSDVMMLGGRAFDFASCADRLDRLGCSDVVAALVALTADLDDDACLGFCQDLGLGRRLRDDIFSVRELRRELPLLERRIPYRRDQLLRRKELGLTLRIAKALSLPASSELALLEQISKHLAALPVEPLKPWFTGADVIGLGIAKGPMVREVLADAEILWERAGAESRAAADPILREIVRRCIKDASL